MWIPEPACLLSSVSTRLLCLEFGGRGKLLHTMWLKETETEKAGERPTVNDEVCGNERKRFPGGGAEGEMNQSGALPAEDG